MPMLGLSDLGRIGDIMREVAASEALPRWRNLSAGDIVEKAGPDDVVTAADHAVEAELTRRLASALPGSVVVGEEAVHADPSRLGLLRGDSPAWIIDPIDGTSAFAAGSPDFAVMVGLVARREIVAGWILIPVTGVLTAAAQGEGVWRAAQGGGLVRLPRPDVPTTLAGLAGAVGRKRTDPARAARIAAERHRFRAIEPAVCAGIEYPRLATGDIHFSLYNMCHPWDHLPGLAFAAEMGFHWARHDGTPYLPGDSEGGLLLAPDQDRWRQIHGLLIGN